MLPEWLPNVHPLFVHFPIALLVSAALADVAGLFILPKSGLKSAADYFYRIGTPFLILTYFSGKNAVDNVSLPALANPVVNEHSDLAFYTLTFFLVYLVVREVVNSKFTFSGEKSMPVILVTILGLSGQYWVYETAEHGAQLVYKYGVGVNQMVDNSEKIKEEQTPVIKQEIPVDPGLVVADNGSWNWSPVNGADVVFKNDFNQVSGGKDDLTIVSGVDPEKGAVLVLDRPNSQDLKSNNIFVTGQDLVSIQADADVNLNEYEGSFSLFHHYTDNDNYDYMTVENGIMKLGRIVAGKNTVFDEKPYENTGWLSLRVVGDGTHFRGYVNDKLITHGHGDELAAGLFGIGFSGKGKILIDKFDVTNIKQ